MLTKEAMANLLERARAKAAAAKQEGTIQEIDAISTSIITNKVEGIDASMMGITPESISTEEGMEAAAEILHEVLEANNQSVPSVPSMESLPTETDEDNKEAVEIEETLPEHKISGVARDDIILNEKQQSFHDAVLKGEDVVEIGAAGTGKTTSVRKTSRSLLETPGRLGKVTSSTKWISYGTPGCIVVSYTRKAVNNIRHAVIDELKRNVLTMHKVLEFAPVFYEIEDPANPGFIKTTMRFEPNRKRGNPIPSSVELIIYEESSMIGVELYALFQDAFPHPHQEVFLGDIQQLPPVFGLAILGFKMLELNVIELTEVYRQARESPILDLAWKILEGKAPVFSAAKETFWAKDSAGKDVTRFKIPSLEKLSREAINPDGTLLGKVVFQPWQKKNSEDLAMVVIVKQLKTWKAAGYYNPAEDIILCPFNKKFGTIELNLGIMQFLGEERNAVIHEVIAGYNKYYLAVGDRVLFDKEDAVITSINVNGNYLGKAPEIPSAKMNRWGHLVGKATKEEIEAALKEGIEASASMSDDDILIQAADVENRVNAASHVITIRLTYGDEDEISLDNSSQINNLLGGYALTVHKAQGSEYEKGFLLLHHSHAVMNSRELLYTAVTRFKKSLHIICEADTFYKGILSQRIKGNTWKDKCEIFKGKQEAGNDFDQDSVYKAGGEYIIPLRETYPTNWDDEEDPANHTGDENATESTKQSGTADEPGDGRTQPPSEAGTRGSLEEGSKGISSEEARARLIEIAKAKLASILDRKRKGVGL